MEAVGNDGQLAELARQAIAAEGPGRGEHGEAVALVLPETSVLEQKLGGRQDGLGLGASQPAFH